MYSEKKVIGSDNVALLHVSIFIIVDKASCITCTQHIQIKLNMCGIISVMLTSHTLFCDICNAQI